MDIFEWDENTPVTANNLNEMQNQLNDNIVNSIESGNGYIKYSDGTLICYGQENSSASGYITINFPINFIAAPTVVASQSANTETTTIVITKLSAITTSSFRVACVYSGGYLLQFVKWVAIGKWK